MPFPFNMYTVEVAVLLNEQTSTSMYAIIVPARYGAVSCQTDCDAKRHRTEL